MKKLVGLLLFILTIYCIYFDLTVGTLPHVNMNSTVTKAVIKQETGIPYFKVKVNPGDTLISIVEHQIKKPMPVSISDLIRDFQSLNPGVSSEIIRIGKTYRFPDYSK